MQRDTGKQKTKTKLGRYVMAGALFAALSLAMCVTYTADGTIAIMPYDPARIIALIAFGIVLWKAISGCRQSGKGTMRMAVVAAIILSAVLSIGCPIEEANRLVFTAVTIDNGTRFDIGIGTLALIYTLVLVGNAGWIWASVTLLFGKLDAIASPGRTACHMQHGGMPEHDEDAATALACQHSVMNTPTIAIILLLCWLPYLIVWFPGAITADQNYQLASMFRYGGVPLTDKFPYLVGIVYASLYRLGTLLDASGILGIFLMSLLQLVISLFVCTTIVHWIQLLSDSRFVRGFSLAFLALFPLVPTYTISIGKDGLHAFLLALLCLQAFLFIESKHRALPSSRICSPLAIAIVSLLVAFTRNNGIFLVVPPLVVIAIATGDRRVIATVVAVVIVSFAWMRMVIPSLGVPSFGPRETLTIPAQIVGANLSEGNDVDSETRAVLERSYSVGLDVVSEQYDPDLSDHSKDLLVVGESGHATVGEYCRAALRIFHEHPLTSFVAVCRTTMSLYPATSGSYWSEDFPYFCSKDDTYSMPGWCPSAAMLSERGGNAITTFFRNALVFLHRAFPLSIAYTPGTYFFVLVLLYCYMLSHDDYDSGIRLGIVCGTLPLVMLEAVLAAAPCGSVRYALPLMFSLPFLLMMFETTARGWHGNAPCHPRHAE